MSQLVDDLRAVRARIERPEQWIQGLFWADANGHGSVAHNGACRFCLVGAIELTIPLDAYRRVAAVKTALRDGLPPGSLTFLTAFNDAPDTAHADVLALLDRAIARAEEAQP